eukprot:TRINITY_DN4824_c0_g1_i1.p1 TRINITY_DN4824_c0_g1~~TRINITY_DN4824_c0_g1_i1.p1  ORF type:complete len:387 (+),score=67.88 TRINITY_DN4824_c0_g1_i1:106-1161(+)
MSAEYDKRVTEEEKNLKRRGLDLLGIRQGESILEIGYGTGWCLARLIRDACEEGKVHGVDISPKMRELCIKRLQQYFKHGFTQEQQDKIIVHDVCKRDLPYSGNQFDAIFSSFTFESFTDAQIKRSLRECHRVLKSVRGQQDSGGNIKRSKTDGSLHGTWVLTDHGSILGDLQDCVNSDSDEKPVVSRERGDTYWFRKAEESHPEPFPKPEQSETMSDAEKMQISEYSKWETDRAMIAHKLKYKSQRKIKRGKLVIIALSQCATETEPESQLHNFDGLRAVDLRQPLTEAGFEIMQVYERPFAQMKIKFYIAEKTILEEESPPPAKEKKKKGKKKIKKKNKKKAIKKKKKG